MITGAVKVFMFIAKVGAIGLDSNLSSRALIPYNTQSQIPSTKYTWPNNSFAEHAIAFVTSSQLTMFK